jgi:hypothetical protein
MMNNLLPSVSLGLPGSHEEGTDRVGGGGEADKLPFHGGEHLKAILDLYEVVGDPGLPVCGENGLRNIKLDRPYGKIFMEYVLSRRIPEAHFLQPTLISRGYISQAPSKTVGRKSTTALLQMLEPTYNTVVYPVSYLLLNFVIEIK